MPLSIIRNDITRVSADAIVNTANPHVAVGEGTDLAIYEAAGMEALLDERAKIGDLEPGKAAVTPAFALDAKYIIHTVGPAWRGGDHGEKETVAQCYRNCLREAVRLECESIAFPLISTGTYGFPKDAALDIAVREFTDFLDDHEMDISLVVYDKESFALSSVLFSDIRSYISDAEAQRRVFNEALPFLTPESSVPIDEDVMRSAPRSAMRPVRKKASGGFGFLRRKSDREEKAERTEAPKHYEEAYPDIEYSVGMAPPERMESDESVAPDEATGALYSKRSIDESLEKLLNTKEETFQQMLFRIIDSKGMTDPEVYKKANIDRKLFSKIRSNVNYNPTKKTAIAFAIALGLNLDETTDLLRRAGLSLSPSNHFDIIVKYCIEHGFTNIHEVNCILFEFDQMLLGA